MKFRIPDSMGALPLTSVWPKCNYTWIYNTYRNSWVLSSFTKRNGYIWIFSNLLLVYFDSICWFFLRISIQRNLTQIFRLVQIVIIVRLYDCPWVSYFYVSKSDCHLYYWNFNLLSWSFSCTFFVHAVEI